MTEKIRILFLAASSPDGSRLKKEAREIGNRLWVGTERESFQLITEWEVRPGDLQGYLLKHQPHIVHLAARGTEAGEVFMADDHAGQRPVSGQALAELFSILRDNIRVVVLSADYADRLAAQLTEIIDYAVSINGTVDSATIVTFSTYFYQALSYGRTVIEGFKLARNQLMIEGAPDYLKFVLSARAAADESLSLSGSASDARPPDSAANAADAAQTLLDDLGTVRRLSEIAASDAQFIINDRFGTLGGDVRLDQGLYVDRSVERNLARILDRKKETPTFILVVGEAGRGKTSLQWHLYRSLAGNEAWEPWFIKSTLFIGLLNESEVTMSLLTKFNREHLLVAAMVATRHGLRPIVLLDTIDLLLRDEEGRDFVLDLVLALLDKGCFVIATCRPQEAVLVYPIDPLTLTLRGYEEGELAEAINKHAARFYAASVRKNYAAEFLQVLNAVARGLPVREVCSNPLTLRMLFTIYAPAAIPEDINVFKLYKEYWAYRVERDLRAGSPFPARPSADLGEAAAAVAVAMLAEGIPELDVRRLDNALAELGRPSAGVRELIDRGVLHDSEAGTVAFFHQTFFEHSAARALLMWLGVQGLSVLRERIQSRPNDLFVGPVYEQALLLSEHQTTTVLEVADRLLIELLKSDVLSLKSSGVYVYCHRQAVAGVPADVMREFLIEADESTIVRFLELTPNMPAPRLGTLFAELDVIWERGNWREHDPLLKLLERLVPRDFNGVKMFVKRHGLIEYVLTKPPGFTGEWKLLRMLTALAEYDPASSLRLLMELYVKAIPHVESRDLQTAVLHTLYERADLFGAHEIATRFEADTAQLNLDRARHVEALSVAYGRLLSVEWQARKRSIAELIDEVKSMAAGLKLIARVRGLAFMLVAAERADAEVAFSHFQAEDATPREWLWTRIIWPHLLAGGQPDLPAATTADHQALPAVLYARRETTRILSELSARQTTRSGVQEEDERLAQRLRTSLREASLPPEVLLKMLDIPALSEPGPWLKAEQYAPLLVDAFVAGHPGAIAAMNLLLAEPEKLWPEIKHLVGPRLKRLGALGGRSLDTLLVLTLKTKDEARLLRALEQAPQPAPDVYRRWRDELYDFQQSLLRSSSTVKRSSAVRIWSQLLRLDLVPAPELDQLMKLMNEESDARVRGQFMDLIGQASGGAKCDISSLLTVLEPLATASEIDIREKALAVMIKIVAESTDDPAPYAMRMLNAALSPTTNAARLSFMRPLIKRLIDHDVALATEVFERLLLESRTSGLGINGSRKLLGRFKSLARSLVRASPLMVSRKLLSSLSSLDRILGVLVVDAVCHEALNSLTPELDELLKQEIHSDVKQVVLRYKYIHDRPAGWPALYSLLRRNA
jgi:hypothetical protein